MTETIFKAKNLINALSVSNYIRDKEWNEIQLKFEGNKLISDKDTINKVSKISVISENIKDLSWIEVFTNLTDLYLSNNKIKNLSPLSNLTKIKDLDLYNNQIENITPLTNLKNLKKLDLWNNKNLWKLAINYIKIKNNNDDQNENSITDKWFNIYSNWEKLIVRKI